MNQTFVEFLVFLYKKRVCVKKKNKKTKSNERQFVK